MNLAQFLCHFQSAMASIDAGQYSLSSDEKPVEFECSPCKDDGLLRESRYYCPECSEYFCSSCEASSHRRLKATKSHKLLPASEATKTATQTHAKLAMMICACNRDTLVEFICDEHRCLICSECKNINHRKCKMNEVEEKSKSFNTEVVNVLLQQAKSLEDKANELCAEHTEHLAAFEASQSECREEINRIRDQMVQFIEKLAKKALAELDDVSLNNPKELTTNLLACKSVIEKLKQDQALLQEILSSDDLQHMLVADFVLKGTLENYECLLGEVEKEMQTLSIGFKADTTITDIQNNVKKLGDVILNSRLSKDSSFPDNLLLLKPVKEDPFDVTPRDAGRMTGSAFLPNKNLAICDFDAQKLKLLDQAFKEKAELKLPASPWGVASCSATELIVTLTLSEKLQFIALTPTLSLGSNISVGKKCFDVETVGKDIYVLCTNDPGEGEVRVLDYDGNIKKRLGMNDDGTFLFSQPLHMSISHDQKRVFVSDYPTHAVFCLSLEGNILHKFHNDNVQNVRGVLIDKRGNLLICNSNNNLHKVEVNGSNFAKFLTEAVINNPYCLNYRQNDHTLVVTCSQKLIVFNLK